MAATSASRSCTSPTPHECRRSQSATSGRARRRFGAKRWRCCGRLEAAAFVAAAPLLRRTTRRGDGHPVLVLPGFTADDASTVPLRWSIRGQGYSTHPWRLGRNIGPTRGHRDGHQVAAAASWPNDTNARSASSAGVSAARTRVRSPASTPTSSVRSSRWAARTAWSRATRARRRRCGSASSTSTTPTSTSIGSPSRSDPS